MAVLDSILQLYRKVLFVDWKMAFNVIAVKKKCYRWKNRNSKALYLCYFLQGAQDSDRIFRSFFVF